MHGQVRRAYRAECRRERNTKYDRSTSAEAELFGAILAAKEGIYFRELLCDVGFCPTVPTRIWSDSKSCIDLSYDPVSFKKTKHILRAAEGLRDYVAPVWCL